MVIKVEGSPGIGKTVLLNAIAEALPRYDFERVYSTDGRLEHQLHVRRREDDGTSPPIDYRNLCNRYRVGLGKLELEGVESPVWVVLDSGEKVGLSQGSDGTAVVWLRDQEADGSLGREAEAYLALRESHIRELRAARDRLYDICPHLFNDGMSSIKTLLQAVLTLWADEKLKKTEYADALLKSPGQELPAGLAAAVEKLVDAITDPCLVSGRERIKEVRTDMQSRWEKMDHLIMELRRLATSE